MFCYSVGRGDISWSLVRPWDGAEGGQGRLVSFDAVCQYLRIIIIIFFFTVKFGVLHRCKNYRTILQPSERFKSRPSLSESDAS